MNRALPLAMLVAFVMLYGFIYHLIVLFSDELETRVLLGLVVVGVLTFTLSFEVQRYVHYFAITRLSYLGLAYFVLGVTVFIKFILLISGHDEANILKSSLINSVMTLTGIFTVIYSNIGYIAIVLSKVEKEYQLSVRENEMMFNLLEKRNSLIKDLMKMQAFSTVGSYGATVVHEVLQPLTALRFGLENLESYFLKNNHDPIATERLAAVRKPAEKAIDVIENLRNFMVERNVMLKQVDVQHTLEDVIALVQSRVKELDVEILIESNASNLFVQADQHQLERVFFNLMNNALDAIGKGSDVGRLKRIVIKLTHIQQKQFVLIKMIDSGPGIPEGAETKVFEWLETQSGGMGIGLALSRMLVESWQGAISAYSANPDIDGLAGAVFEIKLKTSQS
jgi:signal transduction histidine kinase